MFITHGQTIMTTISSVVSCPAFTSGDRIHVPRAYSHGRSIIMNPEAVGEGDRVGEGVGEGEGQGVGEIVGEGVGKGVGEGEGGRVKRDVRDVIKRDVCIHRTTTLI